MDAPHGDDLSALSPWAPQLARTFVSLASDIAIVMDGAGVIRDVARASDAAGAIAAADVGGWIGRRWVDTVTADTRAKVQQMLDDAGATGLARRREVNHVGAGAPIPVAYTVIRLGGGGPLLAVGRDLRSVAAIQQRFLDAQRELERGYWRTRQAETRYRLLFQVATDAVVVVDGASLRVLESNPAASRLFDVGADQLRGRPFSGVFEASARPGVDELLRAAVASARPAELHAPLRDKVARVTVSATPFRGEDAVRLLVRMRAADERPASDLATTLARLVDNARDGIVVTDPAGGVLLANPAFLALARLGHEAEARGRSLGDWLGAAQTAALLQSVRADGVAHHSRLTLGAAGAPGSTAVDVTATLLADGDQERIGFTLHPAAPVASAVSPPAALAAAIERVAGELGHAALPQLVREVAQLAERHFVAMAVQRAGGDAAAARLLGLSVDGLRRRRRRWGRRAAPAEDPRSEP